MSCNCHSGSALPAMAVGEASTAIVKKKPCGPCAQMAQQIASTIPVEEGGTKVSGAPIHLAGASDDLLTVQAFLQSLSGGAAPAASALAQAQAAADDLSVNLAVQNAMPVAQPGMVTMRTFSVGLMIAGALAAGAGVAYLLHTPRGSR